MDNERRRILRMMAEGTISVEECEELLQALSDRRKDKTEKEVQAVQGGERPVWPYVLLVVLAIVALPVSLMGVRIIGLPVAFRGFGMLPCVAGPLGIALFIFWIWMIVDCLSRLPCDFRLLFTTQHKYEKGAIHLTQVVPAYSMSGHGHLSRTRGRHRLPPESPGI